MSDPSVAMQNAVEAALRASADVKAEFPAQNAVVYTLSAPAEAKYPYIIIGEDQVFGDDADCGSASDIFVIVHVWARESTIAATRLKAKNIAAAVRKALYTKLTLVGHEVVDWSFDDTQHLTDANGLVAHSVLTFSYSTVATT